MPTLFMDCSYGVSGDMVLAALHALGVDFAPLEATLHKAGIPARITASPVARHGIAGYGVAVEWDTPQPLRHLVDLTDITNRLDIPTAIRERSIAAFTTLAQTEAHVHGMPMDAIHFHEVGAIDTLADVVGAFWGLHQLGVHEVVCSHLPWFRGTVECAHGTLPLPAPATLRLLEGKPVYPTNFTQEMITPTGALLVDALATQFEEGPSGTLLRSGTGYGTRDSGGGLRLLLMRAQNETPASHSGLQTDSVIQLESNIDHLTGEELGHCFEALMEAGALDVFYMPGVMKKNRPAGVLRVLCATDMLETIQAAFFHHTHTLGIRRTQIERVLLERRTKKTPTPEGALAAKHYTVDGKILSRPEYEALAAFSRKTGRSLPELRAMLGMPADETDSA